MAEEGLLTEGSVDIFESVSRDVRFSNDGNDKLARFKDDPALLANSYLEQEKINSGKVKMPTDASTPEEKSAFYQKMGRPDNAEGYTLPQLAEGKAYDDAFLGEMKTAAHESGVSDSQFGGLIERYLAHESQMAEAKLAASNAEAETTAQALQKEWIGDYDKNLEISKRAIRELVPEGIRDDFVKLISDKDLDNNLIFIKGLHSIGAKLMDDSLVTGTTAKKEEEGAYVPQYVNSPTMYRNDESEEGMKAKAYFKAKGIDV
jgi:hypothetical protein